MGRKANAKQNSRKNSGRDLNKFQHQNRKEIAVLVEKLLKLTGIFQGSLSVTKNWEHHEEIVTILQEITNLESNNTFNKGRSTGRKDYVGNFTKWLNENGAYFEGVEISEFQGYDLGLKAKKDVTEGSLMLTIPRKIMISEKNAKDSDLASFIAIDPLLQNMPNITLALFLLLQKNDPDSFWKPYIDILPEKYSTILYFSSDELAEIKPSPVFESSLKLYRSIARQYAYFYRKIHTMDLPVLKKIKDIFTFDSYRWAVSTVMTRQNNLQHSETDTTTFIPLWDMCNHEHGKITTDYNKELDRGECYALRDFKAGEQVFIFYGAKSNSDMFLHNGFVYPNNQHDSLSLALGVSSSDPLRETKLSLLGKLGLNGVTHFELYRGENPISIELLAFIRIFNMNQEELRKWSAVSLPGDLVCTDPDSSELSCRAYNYLLTRCKLIRASYKTPQNDSESLHRKNIQLLKACEVQILDGAISYLENLLINLPTAENK